MPIAVRTTAPIPVAAVSSQKPDRRDLVSIALFSGIGLLISLVAILSGIQDAWY